MLTSLVNLTEDQSYVLYTRLSTLAIRVDAIRYFSSGINIEVFINITNLGSKTKFHYCRICIMI